MPGIDLTVNINDLSRYFISIFQTLHISTQDYFGTHVFDRTTLFPGMSAPCAVPKTHEFNL